MHALCLSTIFPRAPQRTAAYPMPSNSAAHITRRQGVFRLQISVTFAEK